MPTSQELQQFIERLARAGFIAAEEEATELATFAAGDAALLESLVQRRLRGEPLAWIIGSVMFCGTEVQITTGVFVPRWQSEPLVRRAIECLPEHGVAIDLCTGSGAIAKTLTLQRPNARVVASELDEQAVACATANGIAVYWGDLFAPLPQELRGRVDVIVGVVPYVPTPALALLPRDTLHFETPLSYDGGQDGTEILRRVVTDSTDFLRPGGTLLLELGGEEAELITDDLVLLGYSGINQLIDEDGDVRGVEATYRAPG